MTRKILIITTCFLFTLLVSCEQKPLYPKKKKRTETKKTIKKSTATTKTTPTTTKKKTETTKKKSDVGIADAADYLTGYTPLKTKQHSKKRLTNIYSDRKKNLEDAVKKNSK